MKNVNKFIPVYRDLKEQIINQKIATGNLIPSEGQLCAFYKISRPTLRLALQKLVNEGLISKLKGKGSVVLPPKIGLGILSIEGTTSSIDSKSVVTKLLKAPTRIDWPNFFFFQLNEEEQSHQAIYFERVRIVNSVPLIVEKTYLLDKGIPDFMLINLENKSLFKSLEANYNIEIRGGQQRIKAIIATEESAKLLSISVGTPLVQVERKIFTSRKGMNIYSFLICNTENCYVEGSF